MVADDKVNILLVDDQMGKLLSYEVVLKDLGENLVKAGSAREALEHLLRTDIALILIDVCMPELDGFQLATMIREHPRFQKIAMIFISAVQVEEVDRLRGYEVGAVDYVPVPVVPEVLRAKVRIFIELYRKTRDLERLNRELEDRVVQRTAELEASTERLRQSEARRTLALAAAQMGSWDLDLRTGESAWDDGQYRIFGVDREGFGITPESVRALIHPDDRETLSAYAQRIVKSRDSGQMEFRVVRPDGEQRWCVVSAAVSLDAADRPQRMSGVVLDITERKEAEQRQMLLAQEVDHRARNTLSVVQSMLRLTRADSVPDLVAALDGRVRALSRAHTLLSNSRWQGADLGRLVAEEMAPYLDSDAVRITATGPTVLLRPSAAQAFALALHELATNAAKYGALSTLSGQVAVHWILERERLVLKWTETGGPPALPPAKSGFGTRVVTAGVEHGLRGEARFDWQPEGLRCTLSIPCANVVEMAPDEAAVPRSDTPLPRAVGPAAGGMQRILVVEDEPLVAIMMRDMLIDMGFAVVGPVGDQAAGMALARSADIDIAILDVTLGDATAYPIAELLTDRAVPFIFVTGYEKEAIDSRYGGVPVLQKPVDPQSLQSMIAKHLGEAGISRSNVPLMTALG